MHFSQGTHAHVPSSACPTSLSCTMYMMIFEDCPAARIKFLTLHHLCYPPPSLHQQPNLPWAPEELECRLQSSPALVCALRSSLSSLAHPCRGPSFDTPDDPEVRAPLPAMRDRLYGADMSMLGRPTGQSRREPSQVDAFRDFRCVGF